MIVVGLDPGLGVKSPTGFVAFDMSDYSILLYKNLWTQKSFKQLHFKLADLSNKLYEELETLSRLQAPGERALFATEYFVMKGKGGQSLQRLVGAYYSVLPSYYDVIEVQNTGVKQVIGGTGKGDKRAVAEGVHSWLLGKNKESAKIVWNLINEESWDILDAMAIGITGYLKAGK